MPNALILAAHGSSDSALAADQPAQLWRDRLRDDAARAPLFQEIHAAFWKQDPPFSAIPQLAPDAETLVVVPFFTASGYFVRVVLARELDCARAGLSPRRRLLVAPPLGEHPGIAALVSEQVRAALAEAAMPLAETALLIVGHGTNRHAASGDTSERLAAHLRTALGPAESRAFFLDQDPPLAEALATVRARNLLVFPFLAGGAGHEFSDIPEALGIAPAAPPQTAVRAPLAAQAPDGRRILILPALGWHPGVGTLLLELARETLCTLESGHP